MSFICDVCNKTLKCKGSYKITRHKNTKKCKKYANITNIMNTTNTINNNNIVCDKIISDIFFTEEQKQIISNCEDFNVFVDSVPGAGKTTTIIGIGMHSSYKNILVLTYNKQLQVETCEKINQHKLQNKMDLYTYHGVASKLYSKTCRDDSMLNKYIKTEKITKKIDYDLIIIDEAQDLNLLYFELICIIYQNNNKKNTKFVILGDNMQCIYEFKESYNIFLTNAENIFNFNKILWKELNLTESFRLTPEIADFINNICIHKNKIKSVKEKTNNKPQYIVTNLFNNNIINYKPLKIINNFINNGYNYSDIFILSNSVKTGAKSPRPCNILENILTKNNIPVFVPNFDSDIIKDIDFNDNQIIFSSFHQVKGRERKVAIIVGFDDYYESINKSIHDENDILVCNNPLFVALSRASEHLVLLHHKGNKCLPFITNLNDIKKYTEFTSDTDNLINVAYQHTINNVYHTSPTELVKYIKIDEDLINNCYTEINDHNNNFINVNVNKIYCNTDFSCIIGEIVPIYIGVKLYEVFTIQSELIQIINTYKYKKNKKGDNYIRQRIIIEYILESRELISSFDIKKFNLCDFIHICVIWHMYKSKYTNLYVLLKKNNHFGLIDQIELDNIITNIISLGLGHSDVNDVCIEYNVNTNFNIDNTKLKVTVNGYVDLIASNKLYEFKFVNEIKNEHKLQLIIYKILYENDKNNDPKTYFLYNIQKNTYFQLTCDYHMAYDIVNNIINNKYNKNSNHYDEIILSKLYRNISNAKDIYIFNNISDNNILDNNYAIDIYNILSNDKKNNTMVFDVEHNCGTNRFLLQITWFVFDIHNEFLYKKIFMFIITILLFLNIVRLILMVRF